MKWLEFAISSTHEASDAVVDFLTGLGAAGVQVNDPVEFKLLKEASPVDFVDESDMFASGNSTEVDIRAYFSADAEDNILVREPGPFFEQAGYTGKRIKVDLGSLIKMLCDKLADLDNYLDTGSGYQGVREVFEEDWAENWKKYYQTVHLTNRLVINPSWIKYDSAPGEIVVSLDPGSAFGTGTHESTALCAEYLDSTVKNGSKVLDLGTGSGILAIIAALLGAEVEAVDIDPRAVSVARENARANNVDIYFQSGELHDVRGSSYDLIAVNIIADVIIDIMPELAAKLAKEGELVTSGIISDKAANVIAAAESCKLTLISRKEKNDWVAMKFRPGS